MRIRRFSVISTALMLGLFATAASAATITGDPSTPNTFGWSPNSTNALNYAMQTPGHVGQVTPYVILLDDTTPGQVTLEFHGAFAGVSFFETRIDGLATGLTPHAVVIGDTQHTNGTFLGGPPPIQVLQKTFFATNTVEIRLALGGERDFDFDWTTFNTASVPEPASMLLLGLGLLGAGAARKRVN